VKSAPELITKVKAHEAFREYAYPDPASPLAKECRKRGFTKLRWGFEPAAGIIAKLPQDLRKIHGNPWTIGYGETQGVTYDMRWSKDEAHRHLVARLQEFENGVLAMCTLAPNPNECAALVSFAYNAGLGGLKKSSVLRNHNAGNKDAAARAFNLWTKAGGQVCPVWFAGVLKKPPSTSSHTKTSCRTKRNWPSTSNLRASKSNLSAR